MSAVAALMLAVAVPAAVPCTPDETHSDRPRSSHVADAAAEKSRAERERCKKVEGRVPKDCPGGERLPEDKRSPLDKIPPLSPLVA